MIIAIDFDGTIVDDCYPEIGPIKPNAKEIIDKLHTEGHYIIIWTCRTGIHGANAEEFLIEKNIKFHQINKSNPENVEKYKLDTRKVYADIYVDDKGLIELPDWNEIYKIINKKQYKQLNLK